MQAGIAEYAPNPSRDNLAIDPTWKVGLNSDPDVESEGNELKDNEEEESQRKTRPTDFRVTGHDSLPIWPKERNRKSA